VFIHKILCVKQSNFVMGRVMLGLAIVALMPVGTAEAQKAHNQAIFLENFFGELRRKVPVGK
jgi:hypothetical protein